MYLSINVFMGTECIHIEIQIEYMGGTDLDVTSAASYMIVMGAISSTT